MQLESEIGPLKTYVLGWAYYVNSQYVKCSA